MNLHWRHEPAASDRQAIRRIVETTGVCSAAEVDVAVELVDERLTRGPSTGYHFTFVEKEGEVIGYACYGPIACTLASYDLYWIAVDKQNQGGGLGRRIMEIAEARMGEMGAARVYIDTSGRSDYLPTRRFYERCGYKLAAELEDFYAPGDSKVVYCRLIAKE